MSYRESLLKSIEETEVIINNTKRYYEESGHPPFIAQLEIGSLQKRLDDLKRQLSEIESVQNREELKIKFHPPDLPSGKISARTFSSIVWGIQSISDSIANTRHNQPSRQGRIPSDILKRHTWLITAQEAGSFEVTMEMIHDEQLTIDEPSQTLTASDMFFLFTCSNDSNLLFETVSKLGSRALGHYKELTRYIRDEGTPIDIEWISSQKGTNYVRFDPDKASRIYDVLNNISEGEPEEVEVIGRLTGAESRLKTFRLETVDGQFISGSVAQEKIGKVGAIVLESLCKTKLIKIRNVYKTTGKEKITWILEDIDVIE